MDENMTGRTRLGTWLIISGCFLFMLYGIAAGIFSEPIAAYQYHTFTTGKDFHVLADEVRAFSSASIVVVGLMGAGLAICSGTLFWLGLSRRIRPALILGLIGGTIGVASLSNVHIHQKAWLMFMVDNICLLFIIIGMTIATKDVLELIRGKKEESQAE
jgi:hypothetical protein